MTKKPVWRGLKSRHSILTAICLIGFSLLYLFTRSEELTSDGPARLALARVGDAREFQYGDWGHFMQTPLSHGLSQVFSKAGVSLDAGIIFLALGFLGNLLGLLSFGLAAERIFKNLTARYIALTLYGLSLVVWLYWNGETLNLALGLAATALLFSVEGNLLLSAVLLGLSAACRLDFFAIAPGLCLLLRKPESSLKVFFLLCFRFGVYAFSTLLLTIVTGGYIIGKYASFGEFLKYIGESTKAYGGFTTSMASIPFSKVVKGFFSSFTAAAHVLGDAAKNRISYADPRQLCYFLSAAFIVGGALWLTATAFRRQRKISFFSLALFIGPQLLFNVRYIYQSEEYHASSLLGFLLLMTAGFSEIWASSSGTFRKVSVGRFAVVCWAVASFLFASFGVMLPIKAHGERKISADLGFEEIFKESKPKKVIVMGCSENFEFGSRSGVQLFMLEPFLRLNPEIESLEALQEGILDQLNKFRAEGDRVFILGTRCQSAYLREFLPPLPDIFIKMSEMKFDFLSMKYRVLPTTLHDIPLGWTNQSNPLSWQYADLYELVPRR